MREGLVGKGIVLGIIVLFVGASIAPGICRNVKKVSSVKDVEKGQDYTDDASSSGNNYQDKYSFDGSKERAGSGPWWDYDWNCRRNIKINHSFIDASLTNFPVLVVIDSTIGAKCDDGDSIRFISMDNSFEYYYEIEEWNGDSGNSYVWVNITHVSHNVDTIFFMYYNKSDASDNQNPSDVWSCHYEAVFHMNNATALHDSAGSDGFQNSTTTSGFPFCTDGKIGPAIVFDGISDCYSLGDVLDLGLPNHPSGCDWAFCFWGKMPPHDYTHRAAYAKYCDVPLEQGMRFTFGADSGRDVYVDVRQPIGIVTIDTVPGEETKWHFYTFYYNSAKQQVYTDIDRTLYQANGSKAITNASNEENAYIGCDFLGNHHFYQGLMDEMRFTIGIPITESWLDAVYHNTNHTPGFMIFGDEEMLNFPPNKPTIHGPTSGKPGTSYSYNFNATDPDGDDVFYYIEWGDESPPIEWFGPFNSGVEVPFSHTFTNQGTYNIYAKAKDIYDAESEWTEFTVTMPRDKFFMNALILQFLEKFPVLQRLLSIFEVYAI